MSASVTDQAPPQARQDHRSSSVPDSNVCSSVTSPSALQEAHCAGRRSAIRGVVTVCAEGIAAAAAVSMKSRTAEAFPRSTRNEDSTSSRIDGLRDRSRIRAGLFKRRGWHAPGTALGMRHGIFRHVLLIAVTVLAASSVSTAQSNTDKPADATIARAIADHQHLDMDLVAASREQCDMATAALAELSKAIDTAGK